MRVFNSIKRTSRKGLLLGAIAASLLGAGLFQSGTVFAGDCSGNSVIKCGINSLQDLKNKYNASQSTKNIFAWFGISSADISSRTANNTVNGYVTKSGQVFINGQSEPVATGALTAGNDPMPGSTVRYQNGTKFFTRPPNVSFQSSQLSAYIVMKDGVFDYAILHDCGNPVKATPKTQPPKTPDYSVSKAVSTDGTNYHTSVTVKSKTPVLYRITVKSTGEAAARNVIVRDVLPTVDAAHPNGDTSKIAYKPNSLSLARNGGSAKLLSWPDQLKFFWSNYSIGTLNPGETATFYFFATIGPNDTATSCTPASLVNSVAIDDSPDTAALPRRGDTATVIKQCAPPPQSAVCNSLTAQAVTRTQYNFTAKATATNTSITGYVFDFGDGTPRVGGAAATVSHTYAAPGTYTVAVGAVATINGAPAPILSEACKVKVTVAPPPATPECTGLTLKVEADRAVTATVTYTPGAVVKGIVWDFGDGTPQVGTTVPTTSHTYAQAGDYIVKAAVGFTGVTSTGGTPISLCQAPVTFTGEQPAYTCDAFDLSVKPDRTVTATNFSTTVSNASFTQAVIDWGDNSTPTTTADVIGQTHQYAADGTYTVNVTAHFTAGDQDVTASGPACQKPVTFTSAPPPVTPPTPPTPAAPTELVHTGAGSMAGLFAVVTAAGALAYRKLLSRRLNDYS